MVLFLISLEAHQTYSVNLKTIGSQDYRDHDEVDDDDDETRPSKMDVAPCIT